MLFILCFLMRAWYKMKPVLEKLGPAFSLCYAVKPDGRQRWLLCPTRISPDDQLLVVRYQNWKKQIKFGAEDLTFVQARNGIIGLNANLGEREIMLDPQCFMLVGNVLFSPIFNLWLSRQYGAPTNSIVFTYIDHNAELHTAARPMRVLATGVHID
jgi:hypothetical protein